MTQSRCQRIGRWFMVTLLVMTGGGATFQFGGCDPTVSSTLLGGFNDLAVTFVDALFLAIQAQQEQDQGTGGTDTGGTGGTGGT